MASAPTDPSPSKPAKKLGPRLMRGLIVVELVGLVLVLVAWFYPPVSLAALALVGRSPHCAVPDVWRGAERRIELVETIARLQAGTRLIEEDPAGYELWDTPMGRYWTPKNSGGSLPTLLAQQAVDNYGDETSGVRAGDIVLDAGAHVGVYVREALDRGAELVVAIEPAPVNVECLRRNFRQEIKDGRVLIYPKGIWDVEDELPLYEDPDNSAADGFLVKSSDFVASHIIALTPIDMLVRELDLERVDIIKMDIKGAARRALIGGKRTLAGQGPRLVISTEEDSDDPAEIVRELENLAPGYRSSCTSCSVDGAWLLSPDVLLFSQAPAS